MKGDESENGMPCTDDFDLVGAFGSVLGGGGCVNSFLGVGEDRAEDEEPAPQAVSVFTLLSF